MCDFKPGDEVVCVNADLCPELSEGSTYVVKAVNRWPGDLFGVNIVGVTPLPSAWADYVDFAAERFRKVQRRKTDLSIESFLTIKPGFEEPRRPKAPAKRERA